MSKYDWISGENYGLVGKIKENHSSKSDKGRHPDISEVLDACHVGDGQWVEFHILSRQVATWVSGCEVTGNGEIDINYVCSKTDSLYLEYSGREVSCYLNACELVPNLVETHIPYPFGAVNYYGDQKIYVKR